MRFTGTLIEDLMAMVERAEQRAQGVEPLFAKQLVDDEPGFAESALAESWFAAQENADYDSNSIGVA